MAEAEDFGEGKRSPEIHNGTSPAHSFGAKGRDGDGIIVPDADRAVVPGELSFEEANAGGMGRHLGLFSTTLLMYVPGRSRD